MRYRLELTRGVFSVEKLGDDGKWITVLIPQDLVDPKDAATQMVRLLNEAYKEGGRQ